MDKLNTALCGVEDNAERIARLERKLVELKNKKAARAVKGSIENSVTSFGAVSGSAVVVTFPSGTATLKSGEATVASGISPLIAALDGTGELTLTPAVSGAVALVIG